MAILVPGAALAVVVLAVALWADAGVGLALLLAGIVLAATAVWGFLQTFYWKYTLTNRRVFVRHGLVAVREQTARLERVQDVTLRQSLFDRLFGVGDLDIDTAGTEGGALEFRALTEPTQVREILDSAVRAEQHASV